MRYILSAAVLLLAAGCMNTIGPFRAETKRVDDPRYPIAEQQRLGRALTSLPEDSNWVLPPGPQRPGVWGSPVP